MNLEIMIDKNTESGKLTLDFRYIENNRIKSMRTRAEDYVTEYAEIRRMESSLLNGIMNDFRIPSPPGSLSGTVDCIEKKVYAFPEVVEEATFKYAPQNLVTYLTELASDFNAYYAKNKIVDIGNKEISQHRVFLTGAVIQILKSGLWILGIQAPDHM